LVCLTGLLTNVLHSNVRLTSIVLRHHCFILTYSKAMSRAVCNHLDHVSWCYMTKLEDG